MFAGLTEPTDLCDAGFVCVSGAEVSTPIDGTTGYECPAGYYCPKGSDQGVKCPVGTFSNALGLENVTECEPCTPGMHCLLEGELEIIHVGVWILIFCEIWVTTEFGPGWDSNSQPSDLWANH